MKFGIFILLVLGFCFNIVAPYNYGGYQQGVYQQQSYPQNPSPIYTAHRPAVINYGPPQQAVNYAPGPSETQYLQERKPEQQVHQEAIQRKVVEEHSDAIFVEPLPQERPSLYLPSPPLERNYDNYGRVFASEYPVQGSLQWGLRNSHQSGLPVQENYGEGSALGYPQWQTDGYKAIPHQNKYYGGDYEQQIYNKPVQYVAQPQQVKPVEIAPISEKTQPIQPQNGYNGSSNSERQNAYNTVVKYIAPLEQVKAEEASLSSDRTQVIKQQTENYGSTYKQQNAFNTPVQYTQPQQAVAVASSGMKTQAVPPQNQYLDSSYEPQNTYNTPQYLQPVKPVEASSKPETKIQAVPQQNEYYGNPNEQKIAQETPVQYVAQPEQIKTVEASLDLDTKTQVIKQQHQNYGSPYEHQNAYNPVVQYLAQPQQAKPFESSSVSETKIQTIPQKNEYYVNPYEQQNSYNIPAQHIAQQKQKPVEDTLGSETITQVTQQLNKYYGSPNEQKNAQNVPQYVAQPQEAKDVAEALSVPMTQEVQPQNKYYDSTYEQKNALTPVQSVAQPQQAEAVAEASSSSESKTHAVQPQNKYYDSSYEQQNAYNAPAQYKAQAEAESSVASETYLPEKLATKPEVLEYLASASQKGRYLIIHQNGTVEHVDIIDDSLLGNSQYFKSSDLRKETTKTKEIKNLVENITASTPSPYNINYQNNNPSKANKNFNSVSHLLPIVSTEIKPATLPLSKDNTKNDYVPVQTNYNNYPEVSTMLPEPVNNNYHPISGYKQNPTEPHINKPNEPVYYPGTWKNHNIYPPNENKPKTEVIVPIHNPNVNKNANLWHNNDETNPLEPLPPSPFQPNSEYNYHSSTTETVGLNNYRNSANGGHWSPKNEEENSYNPLWNKKSNNPSRVQNNYTPEYEATPVANAKDTDAFNPLVEPTTATALSSDSWESDTPKKLDGIKTLPAFTPPKSLDILDISAEKSTKEFNDNTSSNVESYSEAANSTNEEYENITTTEASLLTQSDDNNYGFPIGDTFNNNDGTVDETTPGTTDMQDTISEGDDEDDDEQSLVETNTEFINNFPVTVEDKMILPPKDDKIILSPKEDKATNLTKNVKTSSFKEDRTELSPADEKTKLISSEPLNTDAPIDAINAGYKEANKEEQQTDVFVTKDATTKKQLGENEVVVDEAFWDAVYSSNETGGFNDLFIFNVKVDEPVIEKNSRSFVLANGTYVEEIEEIYWEHKDDAYPKEMKFTRITRNHDPESIRSAKTKFKSSI